MFATVESRAATIFSAKTGNVVACAVGAQDAAKMDVSGDMALTLEHYAPQDGPAPQWEQPGSFAVCHV